MRGLCRHSAHTESCDDIQGTPLAFYGDVQPSLLLFNIAFNNFHQREIDSSFTLVLLILIAASGVSLGIGIALQFPTLILLALVGTGLPLAVLLLFHRSIARRLLLAKYQKSEECLIQP